MRRFTRWMPILAWIAVALAWRTPLGFVAGLLACMLVGSVLVRFRLLDTSDAVGGSKLRSEAFAGFAPMSPSGDWMTGSIGELGMGGPAYASFVLRDGALVEAVALPGWGAVTQEWIDIPASGLRIATVYRDRAPSILVYDEVAKATWDLHDVQPELFLESLQQQFADQADVAAWVSGLPRSIVPFREYRGLWLPETAQVFTRPPQPVLERKLPEGRTLTARSLLPDDLRLTADPSMFLATTPYALAMDGKEDHRHVCDLDEVVVSPNGTCVAVAGVRLGSDLRPLDGLWLVHRSERWQAIKRGVFVRIGSSEETFFLDVISVGDGGDLTMRVSNRTWTADGHIDQMAPEGARVSLAVEWQESPLLARAEAGHLSLRMPWTGK